jgi:acetate kinase
VSDFAFHRGGPHGGAILVLDAGISTIDFTLFGVSSDTALVRMVDGRLDQLYADARFHAEDATGRTIADLDCADEDPPGHRIAIEFLFNWLEQRENGVPVLAVGHRVIHGGPRFSGPARIDPPMLRYLQTLVPLAPAGQRACLLPIRVIAERWPDLPQVACFETAFYRDVPALEHTLPLPSSISRRDARRYSYDGLSFEAVIDVLTGVDERAARGRTIVVQVGHDASLCALDGGRSVAMASGFDDPDGLCGARTRRLDPDVVSHLVAELRMGPRRVRALLRQRSERLRVAGLAGDLDRLVGSDEPSARVDVEFLLYRITRALEAAAAALSGLDALVFTASTGPHAVPIRGGICRRAWRLGVDLDPAANQAGGPRLTRPGSRVTAWAVPADKRLFVACRTQAVVG